MKKIKICKVCATYLCFMFMHIMYSLLGLQQFLHQVYVFRCYTFEFLLCDDIALFIYEHIPSTAILYKDGWVLQIAGSLPLRCYTDSHQRIYQQNLKFLIKSKKGLNNCNSNVLPSFVNKIFLCQYFYHYTSKVLDWEKDWSFLKW